MLAQKGQNCIILESKDGPYEKICGGLIPCSAILLLKDLGYNADLLLNDGAIKISGVITDKNQIVEKHKYPNNGYGIGASRIVLQKMLIKQAKDCDCEIKFSERVSRISKINDSFFINGFLAKYFISAIGAQSLSERSPDWRTKQTYGISEIIKADSNIEKDYVYFIYPPKDSLDYFWFIPISNSIWNIGYWTNSPDGIKQFYSQFREKYVTKYFKNTVTLRSPKGAICGSENYSKSLNENAYGVGDFAGTCSPYSGAGIFSAIKSVKDLVQSFNI